VAGHSYTFPREPTDTTPKNTQCEDILIGFVGGAYIGVLVSKELLGWELQDGEDPHVLFNGILDITEEEMCKWWQGMPARKRFPYYESPYTPTLPQPRARY